MVRLPRQEKSSPGLEAINICCIKKTWQIHLKVCSYFRITLISETVNYFWWLFAVNIHPVDFIEHKPPAKAKAKVSPNRVWLQPQNAKLKAKKPSVPGNAINFFLTIDQTSSSVALFAREPSQVQRILTTPFLRYIYRNTSNYL